MVRILYLYYMRVRDGSPPLTPLTMNNEEINPILLNPEFDCWISENLMYQLMVGYDINGTPVSNSEIKDSGKSGSKRIYQALKHIEQIKGIKL